MTEKNTATASMVKPKKAKTERLILDTARLIFLEKGFAGASIGDIAAAADINKSLIYHYFKNKEELWKAVKLDIVVADLGEKDSLHHSDISTLRELIEWIVPLRFNLYAKSPDLVKLMLLQRLEEEGGIQGIPGNSPTTDVAAIIENLQNKDEVRDDIPAAMLSYFIISNPAQGFLDKARFLNQDEKQNTTYLSFLKEVLYNALRAR